MLRRYTVGIGLASALAAGLIAASVAIADGNSPSATTPRTLFFEPSHSHPEAGQFFTGLVVVDTLATSGDGFTANCGQGVLGHKHWYGSQRSFFVGIDRNVVVCSWRIPSASAGRHFRIVGATATATGGTAGPATYSWRVKR